MFHVTSFLFSVHIVHYNTVRQDPSYLNRLIYLSLISQLEMTTSICPACQVELQDASRKEHVRSEWHIYNLKRAVAGLPPLPEAEFSKKQAFFASTSGASGIQEASKVTLTSI